MIYLQTSPIIASLVISFAINMLFFLFAVTLQTDKVTDLSYSLSFIVLSLVMTSAGSKPISATRILIGLAVLIWAVRLGAYLFYRIIIMGKDHRFDDKRGVFLKFLAFWLIQTLTVWLVMLPQTLALSGRITRFHPAFTSIGFGLFLLGIGIEALADLQKFRFRRDSSNSRHWVDIGLWRYSRHPNYLGEIILWWGLFLVCAPGLVGVQWLAILGPMGITALLVFVSGIPLLEHSSDKKYGGNPEYERYKEQSGLLLPRLKR